MSEASIPVDLFNPGQVFACLGFLEAAELLLGNAAGGFCTHRSPPSFTISVEGDANPFRVVLEFLTKATIQRLVPKGYTEPPPTRKPKKKKRDEQSAGDERTNPTGNGDVCPVETFPAREADRLALPLRLEWNGRRLDMTHWCDGSSRNSFKLFAGKQQSAGIACQMLSAVGKLWTKDELNLIRDPFGPTWPLCGSSFKFDARKAWTSINAGYSPDKQDHTVEASPVVEMLAAVGLEHARPEELDTREVRYGVWQDLLPPSLARPALGGVWVGVPMWIFHFTLELAGKNKVVTFARQEANR